MRYQIVCVLNNGFNSFDEILVRMQANVPVGETQIQPDNVNYMRYHRETELKRKWSLYSYNTKIVKQEYGLQ